MRATHKRVWLVAFGLAAYAGIFLISRTPRPAAAEPSKNETGVSQMAAQPVTATKQLAKPAPRKPTTAPTATASPAEAPAVGASDPVGDEDPPYDRVGPRPLSEADLKVRAVEHRMLDTRWSGQSTDMEWTQAMIGKIEQMLVDEQAPVEAVQAVDCRKTICRLELAAVGGDNALKLIHAARALHSETWVDHREGEDDAWTLVVFVSHPEYRLSGDGGRI